MLFANTKLPKIKIAQSDCSLVGKKKQLRDGVASVSPAARASCEKYVWLSESMMPVAARCLRWN